MKLIIPNKFFFFALVLSNYTSPFSYDSAVYAAQKGNWKDAHAGLNTIVTHNPDNADVMYDAGVAAYHLGDYCQAGTCFTRAAQCSADKDICFRSHFNAGNAYVDQKDLKSALEQYNKALAIEPDNEYARHNRDRVEEMLKEEQKKEEDQQQDDKQDDEKDKEEEENKQKDQQDKQNQNGNDQDNQEQNDNDNQSGNDKQQGDSKDQSGQNKQNGEQKNNKQGDSQRDNLDKKSQQDQKDNSKDDSKNTERDEHGNKREQQQKQSANNKQGDSKDKLDKKADDAQNKNGKQQGDQHAQTPEKQNNNNDKSNAASAGKQEQMIDDPWLLSVLNNQEMHDKAVNKQLMEAKIRQNGGNNGQNCW